MMYIIMQASHLNTQSFCLAFDSVQTKYAGEQTSVIKL